MRRVIILLLTQVLLWALLAELNHGLSGWQVHVFGGALFVVYPALHLGRGEGLLVAGWAGLLCDAHAPVAFGTHGLLFAAAHLLLFRARERVPRQDPVSQILIVLFTTSRSSSASACSACPWRRRPAAPGAGSCPTCSPRRSPWPSWPSGSSPCRTASCASATRGRSCAGTAVEDPPWPHPPPLPRPASRPA